MRTRATTTTTRVDCAWFSSHVKCVAAAVRRMPQTGTAVPAYELLVVVGGASTSMAIVPVGAHEDGVLFSPSQMLAIVIAVVPPLV